jgi:hypothetical protein
MTGFGTPDTQIHKLFYIVRPRPWKSVRSCF